MTPNKSVLQCPKCEKPLVGIGSKVARIHPVAKVIRDHYMWTIAAWFILIPSIIKITYALRETNRGYGSLSASIGLFALVMVPFILNFFILRLFPIYRITDCPYCGFHEKQKLGLSESGEL